MAGGDPRVERTSEAFQDVVTRTVSRKRPVLPMGHGEEEDGEGGGDEAGEEGQADVGQATGNPLPHRGVPSP
jgi:hypothetical protein